MCRIALISRRVSKGVALFERSSFLSGSQGKIAKVFYHSSFRSRFIGMLIASNPVKDSIHVSNQTVQIYFQLLRRPNFVLFQKTSSHTCPHSSPVLRITPTNSRFYNGENRKSQSRYSPQQKKIHPAEENHNNWTKAFLH